MARSKKIEWPKFGYKTYRTQRKKQTEKKNIFSLFLRIVKFFFYNIYIFFICNEFLTKDYKFLRWKNNTILYLSLYLRKIKIISLMYYIQSCVFITLSNIRNSIKIHFYFLLWLLVNKIVFDYIKDNFNSATRNKSNKFFLVVKDARTLIYRDC